ncbi:hypothetical protein IA69_28730 [Massilia sp. JS1662]|nr:hypothetical protein IA69_28730 [Massilia sp. JS1662]
MFLIAFPDPSSERLNVGIPLQMMRIDDPKGIRIRKPLSKRLDKMPLANIVADKRLLCQRKSRAAPNARYTLE